MNTAAVCPPVRLTIEISEVLYHGIQVSAAMSSTTVDSFLRSALREIAFTETPARRPKPLGAVERAILGRLVTSEVCDLRDIQSNHHRTAVSRAAHKLIATGILERVPSGRRVRVRRRPARAFRATAGTLKLTE